MPFIFHLSSFIFIFYLTVEHRAINNDRRRESDERIDRDLQNESTRGPSGQTTNSRLMAQPQIRRPSSEG